MISDDDLILLSAYIDGELDSCPAGELRQRLLQEQDLRAALDEMVSNDDMLKDYSSQINEHPVPVEIQSLIESRDVRRFMHPRVTALAASILLLAFGGIFLTLDRGSESTLAVLDRIMSGERVETPTGFVEVVASFHHQDGRICREFLTATEQAIACRDRDVWRVELAIPSSQPGKDTYQPAGTENLAVIDKYIARNIDGTVLDPQQERTLIEQGWQ